MKPGACFISPSLLREDIKHTRFKIYRGIKIYFDELTLFVVKRQNEVITTNRNATALISIAKMLR